MVCQNRRRPVVSLGWSVRRLPMGLSCGNLPIVNVIPISLLLILTLALEETRISAAPEMKIRRTLPDLVLPIHPMNRINRATLCNRSERSVRSRLHSTYFRWETGGSFRTSPISSVLGAGVSMPKRTSSKNRSESVPLQVPSDCPRLGCGAWF